MAFIHYSASVVDGQGSRKVVDAYLNQSNLTNEPTNYYAWLAALDGIIDGVIVAGQIRITPVLPTTLGGTGRAGYSDSRVSETGEFRFNLTGSPKHWTQAIPAFADAGLSANKSPNLTATTVAAYVSAMLAGFSTGTFSDNTGLGALASLYGAFMSDRKVKGLRSKTLVTA